MRILAFTCGLAFAVPAFGCASIRVDFTPVTPELALEPRAPADVEVYTSTAPDWDYVVAGHFQEATRDSTPGGKRGLATLLRVLAAEEGCDGVLVGGNVSRFSGEYAIPRKRWRWNDGSPSRRPTPLFERFGREATCIVRVEPLPEGSRVEEAWPREPPQSFYEF